MKVRRTEAVDLDKTFDVDCQITKSWERKDGTRMIRGVASGVAEDRDGERVSKNAITDMARQAVGGMKLTSSHDQDWTSEIGDIERVQHDVENDELVVEAVLPPEGEDPLADKAWNRMTIRGEKLGFSIGGKLKKAYFELSDVGKKRKVLDGIQLRHFMLTKKPSYAPSFAEAVAKTADLDVLEGALNDSDFTLTHDVERPTTTVAKRGESQPAGDEAAGRNAGAGGDGPAPSKDVNGDQEPDDDDKPDAPDEKAVGRHLACPNCGHEFAADLPAELDAPADAGGEDPDQRDAAKTAPERSTMDLKKTVDELRGLVAEEPVEKTPAEPVEKTATDASDVEKMVAAGYQANADAIESVEKTVGDRLDAIEEGVKKSLGLVVDAIQTLAGRPAGRQSIARTGAEQGAVTPADVVAKRATDDLDDDDEASVAKRIDEADSLVDALKVVNAAAYDIK